MGRPLRIALLSYRSKPHSGGQGVYVRALSRELTALGHGVTVFSGRIDLREWATMCTAGFPEPLTFSLRAARLLLPRAAEYDLVHDNQCLGSGLLQLTRAGVPTVATVHHPVAIDRDLELAAAPSLRRRLTLRRWYGFTRMQARVAPQLDGVTTVSENSRRDIETHLGVPADAVRVIPVGI